MSVSIHEADEQERRAAFRNAHESWGGDTTVDAWVEQRLESPRHQRADWWVLTDDGEVAASLGLYPLQFHYRGETLDGFGIGAVYTAPEYRGEGYATELSGRVQREASERGAQIGLLFSDIEPGFYEELGYSIASDRRFDSDALRQLAEGGQRAGLHPIDPEERLEELMIWYGEAHDDARLYLDRDRAYWTSLLDETSEHRFFGVSRPGGREEGYLRVRPDDGEVEVLELVWPEAGPEVEAAAYRALADLALARRWSRIRQHFAPPRPVLSSFDDNRRDREITMLVPTGDEVAFDENWLRTNAVIWPADRF